MAGFGHLLRRGHHLLRLRAAGLGRLLRRSHHLLRLRTAGLGFLSGPSGLRPGTASLDCLLRRTAGLRPVAVAPLTSPGGDLPGFRHIPGYNLVQAVTVFRAEVNLIPLAVESEGPCLDVVRVATQVTGECFLSNGRHWNLPTWSVMIRPPVARRRRSDPCGPVV